MKKHSTFYCTFNIINKHCRRFLRKRPDNEGIYCGKLSCQINHWNTKTDCEEGVYLVRRDDVYKGGVTELSIWNKIQRYDKRANNNIFNVIKSFNTLPNPWLKCNQPILNRDNKTNMSKDRELKCHRSSTDNF